MISNFKTSALAIAAATGWALPAHAADDTAIQQELAAMRAQMMQMAQRIDTLEGQLAAAKAAPVAVPASAPIPPPAITAPAGTTIAWDGAPRISTPVDPQNPAAGTWSFKPRGRLQVDVAGVNAPPGSPGKSLGIATELRRAYIGVEGTIPGNFGYRIEADLANSSVDLTDLYLTYKASPKLMLTLGQHKPFDSMEDMTSDLFTSFMERAAFNSAFGFERRVGFSVTYTGKAVLVQGGVFADNAADLNLDTNNSYSLDGRVVFMPKLAGGQLHLGGSIHYRDFNDVSATARYRARPFVHTTDVRLIDTRAFSATAERSIGAELAYVSGRFHATAESHWMTALRPGLADPVFNGGYAEVGYLLTDDVSVYKGGGYDRIKPKRPLGKGGMGAVQANLRYDWLDLTDAGVLGGRQQVAAVSLLWIPTDHVRFILNYGHLWLDGAAVVAGTGRNYSADSAGIRTQFDF